MRRGDLKFLHAFYERPEGGIGSVQLDALTSLARLVHFRDAGDVQSAVLRATYLHIHIGVRFVREYRISTFGVFN